MVTVTSTYRGETAATTHLDHVITVGSAITLSECFAAQGETIEYSFKRNAMAHPDKPWHHGAEHAPCS